ncbi:hypothetical protein KIN20_037567 [Parelaphostrongylus tenuis]|uniref:Uncharacterized protein n=1 Tax=Parelaphostrongylus tenuis TaxID=148309 RepID=A0AAD5REN3_PARTN|nr:hypothetical protein KIN20_037567 [Parelaphostrongylus tenuis]
MVPSGIGGSVFVSISGSSRLSGVVGQHVEGGPHPSRGQSFYSATSDVLIALIRYFTALKALSQDPLGHGSFADPINDH